MNNPNPQELWLDSLLERQLRPGSAPDELWNRIQYPRPAQDASRSVPIVRASLLALAAVVLLTVVLWSTPHHRSPQELAIQALARGPEELEFRSDTATEIRDWVKARTGLDLPLPSGTNPDVRMSGVCAVRGGSPNIEVAYRVRGHKAALLISKASHADSPHSQHQFLKCESVGPNRISSWTMRGHLYTLAFASHSEVRDECLLCHNGADHSTLQN